MLATLGRKVWTARVTSSLPQKYLWQMQRTAYGDGKCSRDAHRRVLRWIKGTEFTSYVSVREYQVAARLAVCPLGFWGNPDTRSEPGPRQNAWYSPTSGAADTDPVWSASPAGT